MIIKDISGNNSERKLLVNIPMPSVAGVQMRNVSLGSDDGYVVLQGEID